MVAGDLLGWVSIDLLDALYAGDEMSSLGMADTTQVISEELIAAEGEGRKRLGSAKLMNVSSS